MEAGLGPAAEVLEERHDRIGMVERETEGQKTEDRQGRRINDLARDRRRNQEGAAARADLEQEGRRRRGKRLRLGRALEC